MKKLVLLDLDGTIYLGNKLFDFVPEVFDFLNKNDIQFVFLTNNSSVSLEHYVEKVNNMGIKCNADNFYTSIETTIKYMEEKKYKNVFILGVKTFKEEVSKKFNLIETYDKNQKVDAVVASFDRELVYKELEDASLYIQNGSDFIATNMDWRCPIEEGKYIPDCGGLCKWLEMTTDKKPLFLGKPAPDMIYQVAEKFNVKLEDMILCGDRYYTDIMAGINAGIETMGVLTGETTKEMYLSAEKQPTYIAETLKDLIEVLKKK